MNPFQYSVPEASREGRNVLAVDDPGGERRLFISQVLPFGASASVYGFNKIVRAIHRVGTLLFGLVWSNYYDDFPQLDLQCCGDWAQEMAEQYLELIGWVFSTKPTKRLKMCNVFSALGVMFDLRASADGLIRVANKESRVAQLLEVIENLLQSGAMTEAEAATLRGRLQFAESQTYGRAVSLHMREVGQRSVGKKAGKHLTAGMVDELNWAKEFLQNDTPRLLQAHTSERKLVIFTDAALESDDEVGSLGLVAFWVEQGRICRKYFFSEVVPTHIMLHFQKETKKVIAGLELLAGVLALYLLGKIHSMCRTFFFVDNEAARACLISMNSSVLSHRKLLRFIGSFAAQHSTFTWIARVPSSSNPADEPSRMKIDHLTQSGYVVEDWMSEHV